MKKQRLYISEACNAKVNYFLTCDDELVKKANHICEILETKGYAEANAFPILTSLSRGLDFIMQGMPAPMRRVGRS